MNKILHFDVVERNGEDRRIGADEFFYQGEFVAFWHTPEIPADEVLVHLPSRRLLTRPQEVRPVYEDE